MDNNTAKSMLRSHELRLTESREKILSLFLEADHALAQPFIESSVQSHTDRVTVYRTLKSFVEKGLIHKVPDDTETPHYALCNTACHDHEGIGHAHHHHHDHVHFKCVTCHLTQCIDNVLIPEVTLPQGFRFIEANLLIQGVCAKCVV